MLPLVALLPVLSVWASQTEMGEVCIKENDDKIMCTLLYDL